MKFLRSYILVFALWWWCGAAWAMQGTYRKWWITLATKDTSMFDALWVSEHTLANRQMWGLPLRQYTDLPINPLWLDSLKILGFRPVSCSKWLNGVSIYATTEEVEQLKRHSFIRKIEPLGHLKVCGTHHTNASMQIKKLHEALHQVGASYFSKENLSGKGIKIGLIDAGFKGAHIFEPTKYLVKRGQIKATRDWIDQDSKNFFEYPKDLDNHGTLVLSLVGGYDEVRDKQFGLATDASYYLCRTDHDVRESRLEMDYWVAALEWMDSCGVRLINSSLGYSIDFDNPDENFLPYEMDGKTSIVARASDIAFLEKGMLIIVSAGNEGSNVKWRYISTPADARFNIAVAATDLKYGLRANYSGIGPPFLPYVKPDLACYASDGTSFAAPVVTGFAACIWERFPAATNKQLREALISSGNLFPFGNNFTGYGIVDARKALRQMECILDDKCKLQNQIAMAYYGNYEVAKKPGAEAMVALIHKSDERQVFFQEVVKVKRKLKISPPPGVKFTTIVWSNATEEVQWVTK